MTVQEFIASMKTMNKGLDRQFAKFTLYVATGVRREAIRNAQRTFNKTQRVNSRGGSVAGVRGGLAGSIQLGIVGRWPGVTIGSPTVPYAAIHEFGGVIRAKKRFLTIPLDPLFQGRRAREFSTLGFVRVRGNLFLVDKLTGVFAYLLKPSVRMPARPYLAPAMETIANAPDTEAQAQKLFGGLI
jgi:phage gpG-like protein